MFPSERPAETSFYGPVRLIYKCNLLTHNKRLVDQKLWSHAPEIFVVFTCLTSAPCISLLWVRQIPKTSQWKSPDGCYRALQWLTWKRRFWKQHWTRGRLTGAVVLQSSEKDLPLGFEMNEVANPIKVSSWNYLKPSSTSIERYVLLVPRIIIICPYAWSYPFLGNHLNQPPSYLSWDRAERNQGNSDLFYCWWP